MCTCLRLTDSRHLPLSSDSHCCTWTATSVWTCRLRRTRWCPPWETAMTAALSSGCSVTWPWASDPSPSPLPPSTTLILTSPGSPHPHQVALTTHIIRLFLCQPGQRMQRFQAAAAAAAAYLPLRKCLLLQVWERPAQPWRAVALGTSSCPGRENDVCELCFMENTEIEALSSQPAASPASSVLLRLLLSCWTNKPKNIHNKNTARHVSAMVCSVNDLPSSCCVQYMQCFGSHCRYNLKSKTVVVITAAHIFPYQCLCYIKITGKCCR